MQTVAQPTSISDRPPPVLDTAQPSLSSASFSSPLPLHRQFSGSAVLNKAGEREQIIKDAPTIVLSKDSPSFGKLALLHSLIDCTITRLGSAALMRDLVQPPTDIDVIMQRRAAILELRSNADLRDSLERALKKTQEVYYMTYSTEEWALRIFTPDVADRSGEKSGFWRRQLLSLQSSFNQDRPLMSRFKALGVLLDIFQSFPPASAQIIERHLESLRNVSSSKDQDLLHGVVHKSVFGPIYSPKETPWYVPTFSVHSGSISFDQVATGKLTMLATLLGSSHIPFLTVSPPTILAAQTGVAILRGYKLGPQFREEMSQRVSQIPGMFEALDAIGELDALLALSKLPERFPTQSCFPELIASDAYSFSATNLHNPCQALSGSSVANDFELRGGTVSILTGPNSGGKSTLSTAIFQNQILAQLGSCIPAETAAMTVADKILFQGPAFTALGEHGRFGTELMATKSTFMEATPKSLVIMDEVGDGTTAEERTEMARAILWGFSRIRCGTLLVTHNTALAQRAEKESLAVNNHLRISDGMPTFKLFPGISLSSNAERVARAIGFSESDITASLQQRGYLK